MLLSILTTVIVASNRHPTASNFRQKKNLINKVEFLLKDTEIVQIIEGRASETKELWGQEALDRQEVKCKSTHKPV